MTFQRTWRVTDHNIEDSGATRIVLTTDYGPVHVLVAEDELEHVAVGRSLTLSTVEPVDPSFKRVGRISRRSIGDLDRSVVITFPLVSGMGPWGFDMRCKVDQHAHDQLPINTPVYLYTHAAQPRVDNVHGEVADMEPRLPHPSTQAPPQTWRFDLTLDEVDAVPYQQLCRVGVLIGQAGGWWDEQGNAFRGPGAQPPQALMQWCADNGIPCSVHAG